MELSAEQALPRARDADVSDGELVARSQAGDEVAFDRLFQRHYARAVNLAFRLHGNMDEAEDIAQTAFIRLHSSLRQVRDGQALVAWLYRTVINLVRDRHKSIRRKPWLRFSEMSTPGNDDEGGAEPDWAASVRSDPARQVEQEELQKALEAAVGKLPLEFREAVVLHHLHGMDVEAIAEITRVPVGTVKSRLARGRDRLRRELMPWFEGA